MTRIPVSRSVLRWAIERSGKASAVQRKFPKVREWERGESQPTLRQLEKLARKGEEARSSAFGTRQVRGLREGSFRS